MGRQRQIAFRQYIAPNRLESTSLVMAELSTIPLKRFQAHWDRCLISSVASSGHHCQTSLSTGRAKPMHFQHLPSAPFCSWPTSNHHHHPSYSVSGLWLLDLLCLFLRISSPQDSPPQLWLHWSSLNPADSQHFHALFHRADPNQPSDGQSSSRKQPHSTYQSSSSNAFSRLDAHDPASSHSSKQLL